MSEWLTLPNLLAGLTVVALNAYVLLGGADFGGGVWDLFASGARRDAQRALVAEAIGPIWEANHVWLILVVVLLFTCFPPAFAALSITLHVPLTLMLIGIVLRGSAFAFRSHGRGSRGSLGWGRVFAIASAATPVFLGTCLGALASGAVPRTGAADFHAAFLAPWLTPFCVEVGGMTLALFAFLAAVYLTVEAREPALQEDFRRRALGAGAVAGAAALGTLALSITSAPGLARALTGSAWSLPLLAATVVAAFGAAGALWTRRYRAARVAAGAQVSLIVWGWALAQHPYLVPPTLTIAEAAAPRRTLTLVAWALLVGACLLLPSLYTLFRIFKSEPQPGP